MQNILLSKASLCFVVLVAFCFQLRAQSVKEHVDLFAKGEAVPPENFVGTVYANMLVTPQDGININAGIVTFEPGARSNWHSHAAGQVLYITEGTGYYQEKGKAVELITKGNIMVCKPGITHWHGASKGSSMTHIATVPDANNPKATVWLKPVTDIEYNYNR